MNKLYYLVFLIVSIFTECVHANWSVTHSGLVLFPTITRTQVFGTSLPGTVWDITIDATVASGSSFGTINLQSTNNDSIRYCTITARNGSSGTPKFIQIGISRQSGATFPAVESVIRTSSSTADVQLVLTGAGQIGGYGIDLFKVDKISELSCSGNLDATITTSVSGGSGALSPQIGTIRSGGDIFGSILCSDAGGQILEIQSTAGNIGSASSTVTIWADNNIQTIEADGSIYADIDVGSNPGVSGGNLLRVVANDGVLDGRIRAGKLHVPTMSSLDEEISCTGDFSVDVTLSDDIHIPIIIGGDFLGEIDCDGSLTDTSGNWDGRIEIGGDLDGDISLEASGLVTHIYVNLNDDDSEWLGEVTVGSTTLGPGESGDNESPYYGVLSSTLGGGAIGLVPFNFHPKDCAPDHGSTYSSGAPTSVEIHHYGPVKDGDGNTSSTPPVRVYEASIYIDSMYGQHKNVEVCETAVWTEVTSGFDYSVSGRVVTITNDTDSFATDSVYQIIPADLVCDDVTGNPDVVYVSDWVGTDSCTGMNDTDGYGFKVFGGFGMFDLNENFALETGDIATWIAAPVDLDDDLDADALDLAALITAVANGQE